MKFSGTFHEMANDLGVVETGNVLNMDASKVSRIKSGETGVTLEQADFVLSERGLIIVPIGNENQVRSAYVALSKEIEKLMVENESLRRQLRAKR